MNLKEFNEKIKHLNKTVICNVDSEDIEVISENVATVDLKDYTAITINVSILVPKNEPKTI